MSLAQRTVISATWMVAANVLAAAVSFVSSILLARLLPVETFGVYAQARAWVWLTLVVTGFGMGGAFLHRSEETEDEGQAMAVFFTLKLIFTLIWTAILLITAVRLTQGELRTALIWLTLMAGMTNLANTIRVLLARRVILRRVAVLQVLSSIIATGVSIFLAWRGVTLWALLASDLVTLSLTVIILVVWQPVWRLQLSLSPSRVRYFLNFGSRNFTAMALNQILDWVDDLWTGHYLGTVALGYYSRAYTFATYPRYLLAMPLNQVAEGTYAELKGQTQRLSQAFFSTNAFLIRSGFLLGGWLALIAPEFIRLGLGEKWLPMLSAFRLMLIFTLFDPLKVTISSLFVAVGKPEKIVRVRVVQVVVLIVGLFTLGPRWGIAGVALAANMMLIVGIGLLLWLAKAYVSFSLRKLFLAPVLAVIIGMVAVKFLVAFPFVQASDWLMVVVKTAVYGIVFPAILLLLEHKQLLLFWNTVKRLRLAQPMEIKGK